MDIKRKKSGQLEGADPLVGGIVRAREFFTKNGKLVVVCCVAVAVIVGGSFIFNAMREANIRKAQETFGVGILDYQAEQLDRALASFSEVANNFGRSPIRTMSAFMMGSIYLQQGSHDQAITWFEAAANGKDAGFVRGQALEGLAVAHEEKGDIAAAVRHLERALRDKTISHRHPALRWRLALLTRDSNSSAAMTHCQNIISDTTATMYHQRAENLLAAIGATK
ncbi:MAG: tetratricopeptide repeat protein [Chitinispirillales bacterium]|nr:tetratricopeptide repeat protein [Chitinispirillales bacterium]